MPVAKPGFGPRIPCSLAHCEGVCCEEWSHPVSKGGYHRAVPPEHRVLTVLSGPDIYTQVQIRFGGSGEGCAEVPVRQEWEVSFLPQPISAQVTDTKVLLPGQRKHGSFQGPCAWEASGTISKRSLGNLFHKHRNRCTSACIWKTH